MRNIYKSPTQELTRLHFDVALFLSPNPQISSEINSVVEGRNLYITNSEDIKEGWYFNTSKAINKAVFIKNEDVKGLKAIYGEKVTHLEKIILTTDQDLIKEGVQAIDDTFLEWFVKNPSCEDVVVDVEKYNEDEWVDDDFGGETYTFEYEKYKIIIPKEEPKQLTDLEIAIKLEEIQREEPKQGTLEEITEQIQNECHNFIESVPNVNYQDATNTFLFMKLAELTLKLKNYETRNA